jgi:hypothetical protein
MIGPSVVVRHSKISLPMSAVGHTRSFGDVGSTSGLPKNGLTSDIVTCPRNRAVIAPIRRTGFTQYPARMVIQV